MFEDKELLVSFIRECYNSGPDLVNENIYKYGDKLQNRSIYYDLTELIDNFLERRTENRFIILPGLRGVGKTTLLFQLYDYLLKKGIDKNQILYFGGDNLNQLLGSNVRDIVEVFVREIHEKQLVTLDKQLFVFVDESQEIDGWSKQGKVIYDLSKNIFMIFTGSVALDLELDVNAVRRTRKEIMFPLSFKEHLLIKYPNQSFNDISKDVMDCILSGDIENISKKEMDFSDSLYDLNSSFKKEWEHFLTYGGFPENIYLSESDSHRQIYSMIEKVVEKDVYHFLSFNNGTKYKIFQILTYLALKKPGELSNVNLAKNIGISSSRVNSILKVLEQTHLIFHVNPYGGAGKTVRKPWKYYFLTPSIGAAINSKIGRYSPYDTNYLGVLSENLVASIFFKMNYLYKRPYGMFYIPHKNHADFLLVKADGTNVPVEVGFGKKSKKQVVKSMNKYGSEYGIVLSDTIPLIKKENDIIHMPLTIFSLII